MTKATRAPKTHLVTNAVLANLPKDDMAKLLANTAPAVTPPTVKNKPNDTVIYNGTEMTRKDAQAEHAKSEVIHGTNFLDLHDIADETLVYPLMKAKVTASMAWMMDTSIVTTARRVFWDTQADGVEGGHIDNFADFLNAIADLQTNENYVEQLGFELNTGRLQSLKIMLQLSAKWHDRARAAAIQNGQTYEPKSFETLLLSEKPAPVKADSIEKMTALAEALADEGDTAEDKERLVQMLIKKATNRAIEMHDSHKLIIPAVLKIISIAGYSNAGEESAEFWQLPADAQFRFINSMDASIKRTLEDISTYRKVTMIEYAGAIKEAKAACARLKTIAQSEKFANV